MEQVRGLTPYQCQSPQYNAVKIDIHQPKVQTPKNNCCKGENKYSLYGQKGKNIATMPLPSNVVLKKEETKAKNTIIEDKKPMVEEAKNQVVESKTTEPIIPNAEEPILVEEPVE